MIVLVAFTLLQLLGQGEKEGRGMGRRREERLPGGGGGERGVQEDGVMECLRKSSAGINGC